MNASASTIARNSESVAELDRPKPEHNLPRALDADAPKQKSCDSSVARVRVLIVRYGHHLLDDDNLVFAHKALRDGIASVMSVDDGDVRIEWRYAQCLTQVKGTHVLISLI